MMMNSSLVPLGHQEGINTSCKPETTFILCFSPESYECRAMAGLLACPTFDDLPVPLLEQWLKKDQKFLELTASGNAPDFHRIPFLIHPEKIRGGTNALREDKWSLDKSKIIICLLAISLQMNQCLSSLQASFGVF